MFFFIFVFGVVYNVSYAGIVINEIMYDVQGTDSGREWVELYNQDQTEVDISDYKFLESTDASNHGLTLVSGSLVIPANGYAVIVSDSTKFLVDNTGFAGTLIKSSFGSLSNTGSTIVLKNNNTIVDQFAYTSSLGAAGTGNSLQKSNSGFIVAVPTPGAINGTIAVVENTGGSSGSGTTSTSTTSTTTSSTSTTTMTSTSNTQVLSAHSGTVGVTYVVDNPDLKVDAGRHRITTLSIPIEFEANVSGSVGNITYDWSFGDGTAGSGKIVSHVYQFAGDYVVVLNANNGVNKAVSRTEVKVVVPSVAIGEIMRSSNGFVEIKNTGQYEVNIQGWKVKSGNSEFVFPRDTIIKSNSNIKFPFKFGDDILNNVSLTYGDNIVADSLVTSTLRDVGYKEPTREEIEIAKEKVARQFALEDSQNSLNPETTNTEPLNTAILDTEISNQDPGTSSSSSIIDGLSTSKQSTNSSSLASPFRVFQFLKDFFTK